MNTDVQILPRMARIGGRGKVAPAPRFPAIIAHLGRNVFDRLAALDRFDALDRLAGFDALAARAGRGTGNGERVKILSTKGHELGGGCGTEGRRERGWARGICDLKFVICDGRERERLTFKSDQEFCIGLLSPARRDPFVPSENNWLPPRLLLFPGP